ncbi:MAG TPA: hypothetical protein QGF95_05250 [Candidatus Latescibacteria bacterium]|jgi:hypothetical protein|nr:hypothetical protein [Candidatus Latescibacterota bacterium]
MAMSRNLSTARKPLGVVLLLALAIPIQAADRRLELTPCTRDIGVTGAECGSLEVSCERERIVFGR